MWSCFWWGYCCKKECNLGDFLCEIEFHVCRNWNLIESEFVQILIWFSFWSCFLLFFTANLWVCWPWHDLAIWMQPIQNSIQFQQATTLLTFPNHFQFAFNVHVILKIFYKIFYKDRLSLIISNNQTWPLSVLQGSGISQVFPVHHCTCQAWHVSITNKTDWSISLYSPSICNFLQRQSSVDYFKQKYYLCQCCKVVNLRCSQFITVPNIKFDLLKLSIRLTLELFKFRLQCHGKK